MSRDNPAGEDGRARNSVFGRQVRDALFHLHDLVYLQTHPLATCLLDRQRAPAARRGYLLHQRLIAAIEALRPVAVSAVPTLIARNHHLLHLRYVEALGISEVCARLGLSESQYHRAHGQGLDAIVSLLTESYPLEPAGTIGPRDDTAPRHPRQTAARPNLPIQVTSFVGRERDLGEIAHLLADARLLTLTGTAGCGKTRLALQVASGLVDRFPDGVWLIELAPLADPALVPQTVAAVLGVREEPGRPIAVTLVEAVRAKCLLLLLDNCEHVIEASALLADRLLHHCPELRLLATSREALGLPGELRWRVPSLAAPPPDRLPSLEDLRRYAAVQLFVDRAAAVVPGFAVTTGNAGTVAEICWRLDGIPLALELAAARLKGMTLAQIAARLDQRFRLLTGGSRAALPRQQTLAALVGWSYDLLREPERLVFDRLAVFAGSFTLEAVEAVCADEGVGDRVSGVGDEMPGAPGGYPTPRPRPLTPDTQHPIPTEDVLDLLARLVEKSLVVLEDGAPGGPRYRLLETLREYAREKLVARGEAQLIQARHAAYYLAVAEQNAGAKWFVANQRHLEADLGNLRAALRWAALSGKAERALWLTGELAGFWSLRGYPAEGRAWIDELLVVSAPTGRTAGRGRALYAAATLTWQQGNLTEARALLDEALAIQRQIDDREGIAKCLEGVGKIALDRRDYPTARRHLEQSLTLARHLPDRCGVANCLGLLSHVAFAQEDVALAEQLAREALAQVPEYRPVPRAVAHDWLGRLALARGDLAQARVHLTESLGGARQADYTLGLVAALSGFRDLAAAQGKHERAVQLASAVARLRTQTGGAAAKPGATSPDLLERSRRALGPEAYAAAWAEGQAMTLEQALAYALRADTADQPREEQGVSQGGRVIQLSGIGALQPRE